MGTLGFSILAWSFAGFSGIGVFPGWGLGEAGRLIAGVGLPIQRKPMIRQSQPSNGSHSSAAPPNTGAEEMRRIAPEGYLCLVGESEAMRTVREQLRRVAAHFRMVLITGEAGTGKEIVAEAMHRLSEQPDAPFVSGSAASCLSLVPQMLARSNAAAKATVTTTGHIDPRSPHNGEQLRS